MDSVNNFFFPNVILFHFAFRTTATIIMPQPTQPIQSCSPIHPISFCWDTIWMTIPPRKIQKAGDLHLLAVQMLIRPTNWRAQPRQFRKGTTTVKGREKELRMEVMVERQKEWQAPPEQILKGIDRAENMFISTYLTTELAPLCLQSTTEQKMKVAMARASSMKHLLCLTSHLSESRSSPAMPPSSLATLVRVSRKQRRRVQEMIYLVLWMPVWDWRRWQAQAAKTMMEGERTQRKLKTSYSLMQAQTRARVSRCMPMVQGDSPSSIAISILYQFETPQELNKFQKPNSSIFTLPLSRLDTDISLDRDAG